jgi:hypothetical protein
MFTINKSPTPRDIRWFAVGMIVGIPAISLLILWKWSGRSDEATTGSRVIELALVGVAFLGILAGLAALVSPVAGRKLFVGWMTLTIPIGIVVSTLMLTLLYVVLLPIFSLIVRRKDPLRKKLGGTTYWEDYKPHEPTLERMQRPF